ncbi:MAG: hypothetical protein PWQ17_395 [Anaerophaga sp.]|nr:hypothetical protein [Anaerophaga sp.]
MIGFYSRTLMTTFACLFFLYQKSVAVHVMLISYLSDSFSFKNEYLNIPIALI